VKDIIWIHKAFGLKAAIRFVLDSVWLFLSRKVMPGRSVKFSDLSNTEVEQVADALGIYKSEVTGHVCHNFDETIN
jgi:hypothetical protein